VTTHFYVSDNAKAHVDYAGVQPIQVKIQVHKTGLPLWINANHCRSI